MATAHRGSEGMWFSPGTPVSSTNKTDRHDIAEILKVELNAIIYNHSNSHVFQIEKKRYKM
jgi:hypothetical protein